MSIESDIQLAIDDHLAYAKRIDAGPDYEFIDSLHAAQKKLAELDQLRELCRVQNEALVMTFASVGGSIPEGIYDKVENAIACYEALIK